MLRFVLQPRRCYAVPSLLGLMVVTFLLIRVVPCRSGGGAWPATTPTPAADRAACASNTASTGRSASSFFVYVGKVAAARLRRERVLAPPGGGRHRPTPAGHLGADLLRHWCSPLFVGMPLGVLAALNHNALAGLPAAHVLGAAASRWPRSGSRSCCSCCFRWNSNGCRCAGDSSVDDAAARPT